MAMNRNQFRKQLSPGLNTVFGMEYVRYPEEWRNIFMVENSEKAFEEDVLMSGFGNASVKAEGAGVDFDNGQEAWTARYNHETIALAYSMTLEARMDNLYGNIGNKFSKALARSLQNTKEVKGANILNYAFTAANAFGDGKELCATDHPLTGGGTFANELITPADLSETSLEDATIAISQFVDERGLPVQVSGKKLIIPTQLQFEAQRILYSDLRVSTADNDTNALKDMGILPGGYSINHRLTDPDAWFIITDCPDGLKHFVRMAVSTSTENEFNTGNFLFKAMERYAFGATDPRGIFGTPGA